jgi:hypothetical protein
MRRIDAWIIGALAVSLVATLWAMCVWRTRCYELRDVVLGQTRVVVTPCIP